jgi:hypothetical protein
MQMTVAEIRKEWEDWKSVRVYFDEGESGWAKLMPDGKHCVIANIPLGGPFALMDIVEFRGPSKMPGGIIQKTFSHVAGLDYRGAGDKDAMREAWTKIKDAMEGQETHWCPVEGYLLGMCGVSYTDNEDLQKILDDAGLSEIVKIMKDDDEDETEGE